MDYLTENHFNTIISRVIKQVFKPGGKGFERHGGSSNSGIPLGEQPWSYISKQIDSPDFCIGQAIKKLSELKGKPDYESWEVEILGALAYTIFAAMYEEYRQEIKKEDIVLDPENYKVEYKTQVKCYKDPKWSSLEDNH